MKSFGFAFSAATPFAAPIVSLPQVRSEGEAHLTFAARLPAKSAQVSIRQAGHGAIPRPYQ
jgi:hypothetical protein